MAARRRSVLIIGASALVVLALGVAVTVSRPADHHPDAAFCGTYTRLDLRVPEISRAISHQTHPGDPSLDTLRGVVTLVWTDKIARTASGDLQRDALVVAHGVRKALKETSTSPLEATEFTSAVAQAERLARPACRGVEE